MWMVLALALQEPVVDVQLRAWSARFAGSILADGDAGGGTTLDADDLGLDGAGWAGNVEVGLRFPDIGCFRLEYWGLALEGGQTLEEDIVFDDVPYPAGLAVQTSIEVDVVALDYAFNLWSPERFRLEGEVEALYIAGRVEVEGGGTTSKAKLNRPLLLPGLRAELEAVERLTLAAELHGIAFSTANVSLRWLEVEVEARANLWRGLNLGLGYRIYRIDVKATEDSTNFDLKGDLHGPYVSIGWTF